MGLGLVPQEVQESDREEMGGKTRYEIRGRVKNVQEVVLCGQVIASLRMLFLGRPAYRTGPQLGSENLDCECFHLPLTDKDGTLCLLCAKNEVYAEHLLSF